MLSIGLMTGTSMDGIDAALLETNGKSHIKELGHASLSYHPSYKILLKAAEYSVKKYQGDLNLAKADYSSAVSAYLKSELDLDDSCIAQKMFELSDYIYGNGRCDRPITFNDVVQYSTDLHVKVVNQLLSKKNLSAKAIDVIGYHGQTLFHRPEVGITIQIGNGQYLAEKLGITVVTDFRSQDVAQGGQGAPFAPLYHQALAVRDKKMPVVVVNCGGIANITVIKNDNEFDLIGFDTGPGNALIDRLVRQRTHGAQQMDEAGQYGRKGTMIPKILQALYEKSIIKDGCSYFKMKPPKSLDYGDMNLISELSSVSLEDACRTLEAFTADTIVSSIDFINIEIPNYWIVAGGGWENPIILQELKNRLKQKLKGVVQIHTADQAGWKSQALEAQIFAYLAVRRLQNQPISLPNITGVAGALSGGQICK